MIKSVIRLASVVVLVGFLAACGDKLTQENFNKISNGMLYAEVVKILGEPKSSEGGGAFGITAGTSIWKGETHQIMIVFLNEKVTSKTFSEIEVALPTK